MPKAPWCGGECYSYRNKGQIDPI